MGEGDGGRFERAGRYCFGPPAWSFAGLLSSEVVAAAGA
jgi:hypothetical protein